MKNRRIEGGFRNERGKRILHKNNVLISVITVVFNGVNSIEDTIHSVLGQSYLNIEYIIIDGGSNDGTLEKIQNYNQQIDYWLSEPDSGIYDAMNKGIAIATGDYMSFMNSGDIFASNDVLSCVSNVLANQDIDILYGEALIKYSTFSVPFKIRPLRYTWKYSPFCHQASLIRASLMKVYRYDLSYKIGADHDFFYRAHKDNKKFLYIDKIICLFDGRDGATKKHIVLAIKDKMNIALKYDFSIKKQLYFRGYLLYIYINKFLKQLMGQKILNMIIPLLKKNKKYP